MLTAISVPLIMALLMGGFGGPVIAWAMRAPGAMKGHERRKEKFLAGKGRDPDQAFLGPHKSFSHNAIWFGLSFGVAGLVIGFVVLSAAM